MTKGSFPYTRSTDDFGLLKEFGCLLPLRSPAPAGSFSCPEIGVPSDHEALRFALAALLSFLRYHKGHQTMPEVVRDPRLDEHFKAIGAVAVIWAVLEFRLN